MEQQALRPQGSCSRASCFSKHFTPLPTRSVTFVVTMTVEKNIKQWVEHQRCEEKVVHDYHDYANEVERVEENAEDQCYTEEHMHTHLSEENFPVKLHYMLNELETDGIDDIVSWQPHGRCFLVHKQQQFVEQVLPL
jgi:hypothetical protein